VTNVSERLWRANPAFRRLTVARVVSVGGDSLSLVALMLHVAATSGHALAVAALLLVGDLVPSLLSPLSGAIGDRFDRKHVMITCELVQGAVLLVAAGFVIMNFIVDLLYAVLDPRIRHGHA